MIQIHEDKRITEYCLQQYPIHIYTAKRGTTSTLHGSKTGMYCMTKVTAKQQHTPHSILFRSNLIRKIKSSRDKKKAVRNHKGALPEDKKKTL